MHAAALSCLLFGVLASGAAAATGGTSAGATGTSGTTGTSPTAAANPTTSANWAGYAVSAANGTVRRFTHVLGTWVQPAVTCTAGSRRYSSFWVGLGGLSRSSSKLEQTGTEADCDRNGVAHYSAWYELVPAGPVTFRIVIAPGDTITASASVAGNQVTLRLDDLTQGTSAVRRLRFARPDTSSAEWIAEAPSTCGRTCRALPLGDFGTVTFTGASATTRNGYTGTIADAHWAEQPITLSERAAGAGPDPVNGFLDLVTAVPTELDAAGGSFAVSWAEGAAPASSAPAGGRLFPTA